MAVVTTATVTKAAVNVAVNIVTSKKGREFIVKFLFTLLAVFVVFFTILVMLMFQQYPTMTSSETYCAAVRDVWIELQLPFLYNANVVRTFHILHKGNYFEDVELAKDYVKAYFVKEDIDEETGEPYLRFLSHDETIWMAEALGFTDEEIEVIELQFRPSTWDNLGGGTILFPPQEGDFDGVMDGDDDLTTDEFVGELIPPCSGNITSYFGNRPDPFGSGTTKWHSGVDICGAHHQDIVSVADGVVITAISGGNSSYGNYVIIKHADLGIYTLYGHLNRIEVSVGQTVSQGDVIAEEGGAEWDNNPGSSTGHHLHFEVRKGVNSYSSAVNPTDYIMKP